jgi:hypothetical protein
MKKNENSKATTNQPLIEVLAPAEVANLRDRKAKQFIQEQLAEVLADRDQFAMEPFFRSRQVAYEIRRLQTVSERKSWAIVYEEHGCLHCYKSELPHAGCGMCAPCYKTVLQWKRSAGKTMPSD